MSWGRFCRKTWHVWRGFKPGACGVWRAVCSVRHHASRITLLLMVVLLWLARPQPAYAHNELRQSVPSAGEILPESPATIRLLFSEHPANVFIRLFDRDFAEVPGVELLPIGDAELEVVASVPTLNPGVYTVQWLTLSQDNHAVSGTFQFEVQGKSPSTLINSLIMVVLAAAILSGIILFIHQNRSAGVTS